jgi:hypothetical protein
MFRELTQSVISGECLAEYLMVTGAPAFKVSEAGYRRKVSGL